MCRVLGNCSTNERPRGNGSLLSRAHGLRRVGTRLPAPREEPSAERRPVAVPHARTLHAIVQLHIDPIRVACVGRKRARRPRAANVFAQLCARAGLCRRGMGRRPQHRPTNGHGHRPTPRPTWMHGLSLQPWRCLLLPKRSTQRPTGRTRLLDVISSGSEERHS